MAPVKYRSLVWGSSVSISHIRFAKLSSPSVVTFCVQSVPWPGLGSWWHPVFYAGLRFSVCVPSKQPESESLPVASAHLGSTCATNAVAGDISLALINKPLPKVPDRTRAGNCLHLNEYSCLSHVKKLLPLQPRLEPLLKKDDLAHDVLVQRVLQLLSFRLL